MREFDYEELVKATDNFSPTKLIGKGSHGWVYKGAILAKDNNSWLLVAIKKPPPQPQNIDSLHDINSKLENEIQVLSSLQQQHDQTEFPQVLKLVGTSSSYEHEHEHDHHLEKKHKVLKLKLMVMDLMPNGSLHDWLHAAKTPPTWPKRVEIAMQIARAMQFLHQSKPLVIHRDIKSSNILFDSQWNAKLADFGLGVVVIESESPLSQPAGTIGYLDPSYTTASKLSTKNDMFSFGVVLLEIISGRKAIDVSKTPASIVEWAVPLIKRQRFDEICDARMALPPAFMVGHVARILQFAVRCVSLNEDDRPSAAEVVMGIILMENWCFNVEERVLRFPIWRSLLKRMRMRKRRKLIMPHSLRHKEVHMLDQFGKF